MIDKQAFEKALAENEDDTATRLVYADWLDEHGQHEEADRQRKWPTAKAWLLKLCEEHFHESEDDNAPEYFTVIDYKDLIQRGWWAFESYLEELEMDDEFDEPSMHISCGNNFTLCDALRNGSLAFWTNWSIVTGMPLPEDVEAKSSYSCAC